MSFAFHRSVGLPQVDTDASRLISFQRLRPGIPMVLVPAPSRLCPDLQVVLFLQRLVAVDETVYACAVVRLDVRFHRYVFSPGSLNFPTPANNCGNSRMSLSDSIGAVPE